ncbi:MAG: hypothetical protein EXR75_00335 [Myxococcales bacterium]|nr:hypothetical protein [Myxococcales bacterium]
MGLLERWQLQRTHLTCPATNWKYVVGACQESEADLVMLDLEDSIPKDDGALLDCARDNIAKALTTLDWGTRKRCFRPRGHALDPELEDVRAVVTAAGAQLEGLVYPKVEHEDEVIRLDLQLTALERTLGLPAGQIRVAVLIESVLAEERAFAIAAAGTRLFALVFGAFDYWSSLGAQVPYRFDHPLVDHARIRIAKAAASVNVPAIAEMTLNYPTKEKTESDREAALVECRRDAVHALELGFAGKWCGIPAQLAVTNSVFSPVKEQLDAALVRVRAYRDAEQRGVGALMIHGRMADRATDRVDRVVLARARRQGLIDDRTAHDLGLDA